MNEQRVVCWISLMDFQGIKYWTFDLIRDFILEVGYRIVTDQGLPLTSNLLK